MRAYELFEWGSPPMEIDGFRLTQEPEYEDDNVKIWHTLYTPDGKSHTLNHTPYENINRDGFMKIIAFYKKNGRVPSYGEFGRGNHDNAQLAQL